MCGIVGFVTPGFRPERLDRALRAALGRLTHRGPDDEGILTWPSPPDPVAPAVGLGCRRLAILDLSASGHQPMVSADGRWAVAYNGEVYNYRELRAELERSGRRFRSESDTEVLVEAFAEWGPAALTRFTGMFAFAMHDRREARVYLARDPFGIKPLYYAFDGDTLVFGSEIPALLEFPGLSRTADAAHYQEFLISANTDFGDATLFADIRRVPAAHYLEMRLEYPRAGRSVRYWTLDLQRQQDCSFDEAAAEVRHAFLESVRLHLRSDVPLGFALSGGIDSSAVVMAARQLLGPGADLHTFSFIPDDPRIDEEQHVDTVVHAARAVSHRLRLSPEELERDIENLSTIQGEPIASPVIYAQYRVFGLARATGITVMLGGQGADEILAGYDRYFAARLASLFRQGRAVEAAKSLRKSTTPYPGGRRAALRAAAGLALPPTFAGLARRSWQLLRRRTRWLNEHWFAERGVAPRAFWQGRGRHVMREMLAHNLQHSQIEALLRYEDRNAMSFSLENRVPFLTPPLVQLLFSLPEEYLLAADGTRKAVFRRAMRGIVPDTILDRADKIGFSVPMTAWFDALRPWLIRRLKDARRLPGLKNDLLQKQWRVLEAGGNVSDPYLLWRCVSLSHWAERFGVRFE